MQLSIHTLHRPAGDALELEIVERKGTGHPDTISDEIAEEFSLALCRYYLSEFGEILHHNVDKVLLAAGMSRPSFGGGEIIAPMQLFLCGRATGRVGNRQVPTDELAREAASAWFRGHFPAVDLQRHVHVQTLVHPGSADLGELFARRSKDRQRLANDTSCGVGYAPLSTLELIVDSVERQLGCAAASGQFPAIGRDIKVMGLRVGARVHLTIACAMVGRFVANASEYLQQKDKVASLARRVAETAGAHEVGVEVNVGDHPTEGSFYLTVTGTSAEAGDDGQAGRGNRVNGLITPYRAMTMESVAGKNPLTHVGKLYNIAAGLMAEAIVMTLPEIASAEVYLVSQIGRPVAQPAIVDVRVATRDDRPSVECSHDIEKVIQHHLSQIETLWRDLVDGTLRFGRWPLRSKRT